MNWARWIATGVPVGLLGGALAFEYWGGLVACEYCWWQRYALIAALLFALAGWGLPAKRALLLLAALSLGLSALLGLYHAGVEYHWWRGLTRCSTVMTISHSDPLASIMATPSIRCDEPQWSLFGLSLAGYNFLISGAAALMIARLIRRG